MQAVRSTQVARAAPSQQSISLAAPLKCLRLAHRRVLPRAPPRSTHNSESEVPDAEQTQQRLQQDDSSDSNVASSSIASSSNDNQTGPPENLKVKRKTKADSTDPVASFLSRRFGLAGGLAWLGFLAFGSLGEQVKTRLEVAGEEAGKQDVEAADQKEVVLSPGGVRVRDVRVGGGQSPAKGLLMVVDYVAKANGEVFDDTKARGKPIVFFYGGRPFTAGLCPGLEQALAGMKAGGRRIAIIPPELGFGDRGTVLRPTEHVPEKQGTVPPGATLEYDIELLRISIPPS